MKRVAILAALITAVVGAARAAPMAIDLEFVLAVDVSRSVDAEEAALQRTGYVSAFRHPSVIDAISHGKLGHIAVVYFEWGA